MNPGYAPKRIAILKPSALGDIVHALPVLSALRDRWPQAHIAWVVNRGFAGLLDGHPDLNEIIPFDRAAFRGGPLAGVRYAVGFLQSVRAKRFDLVVDLQGLARTGLMAALAGAAVRVGFAQAREGSRWAYTHRVEVPDAETIHAVDRYRRVVQFLGADVAPQRWIVPVNAGEVEAVQALLAPYPRPWVAVAAGAKWRTKRWPPEHFAEVLNRMKAKRGGTAVLVGAAEDEAISNAIAERFTGATLDLTGRTSLPRLAAVLKTCDVMLANDTGPLHLAAALGTPCVAPYTCTRIAKHGPYGNFATAAATLVPCAGSYLRQCPNGWKCFTELTPDRLFPALETALRRFQV